jgi:signal transduction histidine kinase
MNIDERLKEINHELRNALAPFANYIEILKMQTSDSASAAKTIVLLERQVHRMKARMDELLLGKSEGTN